MLSQNTGLVSRAWSRVRRISNRAGDRFRGLPVRASFQSQGPAIPPGRLIHLVAGTEDVRWFLDSGVLAVRSIRETLANNGLAIESFDSVLDFGCGVGRVMRHWASVRGPAFHGSDYNSDLIAWCDANLDFARFQLNGLDCRLAADDASFDFAYALSVFTHLSEPLQRFWMDEMARVLRPGGYLLITTHGAHYLDQLSTDERAQFRVGKLVVQKPKREGGNDCAVFHPESYVRSVLARGFDVIQFVPEGAIGNPRQDVCLLRKPVASRS